MDFWNELGDVMNKTELKQLLDAEGFNPAVYSLDDGLPNDRLCLSGGGDHWSVYYSERGSSFDEENFISEGEACEELLRRLRELPPSQTRVAAVKTK